MLNKETVKIIELRRIEEFNFCIDIQKEAWGFESPIDIVPLPIFVLSCEFGGLVLGAFEDDRMVGFSLAFPLVEDGEVVLHSHMTAVRPQYQGRGIGYRIKLYQREKARSMGYKKITWTYDPLQARNAYFNINKLGARITKYYSNFYGPISSKFNKGIPTHRFLVKWDTEGEENRKEREPSVIIFEKGPLERDFKEEEVVGLRIPCEIDSLTREEVLLWSSAIDRVFPLLLNKYRIINFKKEGICYYILEKK